MERVKNYALFRIERGHLEHIASADEAYRDVIIEIESARHSGRDARSLKARFRKHEHLRLHRHIESLQDRRQVSMFVIEAQFHVPGLDLCLKARNRIVNRACGVLDRLVIERNDIGPAQSGERNQSAAAECNG
jgi:hypothetical protein